MILKYFANFILNNCTLIFLIVQCKVVNEGKGMEFFRKHQKIIISVIAVTFIAWTVGLMMLPLLIK